MTNLHFVYLHGDCALLASGTRFRPISLELPKPLFPIAGRPIIQHLVDQCAALPNMINGINIIGYYGLDNGLAALIKSMQSEYSLPVRYLQEHTALGTGGGMFHFRDRLLASKPDAILFMNGDVYADLPLREMVDFYNKEAKRQCCILVKDIERELSSEYGCVVVDETDWSVKHYVEKPIEFHSSTLSCGVYLFNAEIIFGTLRQLFESSIPHQSENREKIQLENDVFPVLTSNDQLFAFKITGFWGSIKSPSSALEANSKYLELIHETAQGDSSAKVQRAKVFVDSGCTIDESAEAGVASLYSQFFILLIKIGPNVSIGRGVRIARGVRIRDAIILNNCEIGAHSCILLAVLGSRVKVGQWCRIQGAQGKGSSYRKSDLTGISYDESNNISDVSVIGHDCKVSDEVMIRSSIVLPHKDIGKSCHCEIVL